MTMGRKSVTILGAGPRGMGVALRAIESGFNVNIIDSFPLSSWTYPNILFDMAMRSPIAFDLVSFCPELNQFSLNTYLTGSPQEYMSQKDIEVINNIPLKRELFFNYLRYIWSYIESKANYIQSHIKGISKEYILLDNKERHSVEGDLVIALGITSVNNIPRYIKPYIYEDKLLTPNQIASGDIKGLRILVVGNGQSAAEYIDYLTPYNQVIWVLNKEPKVFNYPVPSYTEWGDKSALGDYYSRIYKASDITKAMDYLKKVKDWGPSITPYIANSLKGKEKVITKVKVSDIHSNKYIRDKDIDKVVLCTGIKASLEDLPFFIDINRSLFNNDYPHIESNFRSKEGIYFTGELAKYYDGPRQGSLISVGLTSKTIIGDING